MLVLDQDSFLQLHAIDWMVLLFVIGLDPVDVGGNAWEDFLRAKAY